MYKKKLGRKFFVRSPMKKYILVMPVACLIMNASAAILWDGDAGDGLWATESNWDGDSKPGILDDASITSGSPVYLNSPEVIRYLIMGAGTTLEVNDMLNFYSSFSRGAWGADDNAATVNINSGGTLSGNDGNGDGTRIDGYATININSGGTMQYFDNFRVSMSAVLNGGDLQLNSALALNAGTTVSGSSGRLVVDVWGDGLNGAITGGQPVDLDELTWVFNVADGYTPQVGDSWDVATVSSSVGTIGDGSNISGVSADGNWEFTYNLTNWSPAGGPNKGLVVLESVTAIPEPATLGLISVGGLFALLLRRLNT
jgi:hypothetical protein